MIKIILGTFFLTTSLLAHIVQYNVGQKATYVSVFFDSTHTAAWSSYEIFAPDASLPYQKGRTDASGVLSFLPNREGKWKIAINAGSDHGEHFQEIYISIDPTMVIKEINKPLYATSGALISGISIIFGFFGLWFGLTQRQRKKQPSTTKL